MKIDLRELTLILYKNYIPSKLIQTTLKKFGKICWKAE